MVLLLWQEMEFNYCEIQLVRSPNKSLLQVLGVFNESYESLMMPKLPCVVDMQDHQVGAVVFVAVRKINGYLRQAAFY